MGQNNIEEIDTLEDTMVFKVENASSTKELNVIREKNEVVDFTSPVQVLSDIKDTKGSKSSKNQNKSSKPKKEKVKKAKKVEKPAKANATQSKLSKAITAMKPKSSTKKSDEQKSAKKQKVKKQKKSKLKNPSERVLEYQSEFDPKNKNIMKAEVQKYSEMNFDKILDAAFEHSYDLKVADYDVLISRTDVIGARSEYFPKLYLGASTEYTKSFRDELTSISIGDSYINPYTRFQSVLGITVAYNLFDFGVRRGNLDIAKTDVDLKSLKVNEQKQELILTIIDAYSKLEIAQKQLKLNREILALNKQNLGIVKRLYDAKEISKIDYDNRVVRVNDIEKRIHDLQKIAQESLNWLEFYTGYEFNQDNLKVQEIKKPNFDPSQTTDYTKTVTWQVYEKEIKKKELALKVAKRNYLPKLNAYGRYYLYGADQNSYGKSFEDFGPSNATVGVSLSVPVFDGMKNYSQVQRAKMELGQMQVQRDKAIAQWLTRLSTLRGNYLYLGKQIEDNEKILKTLNDKNKATQNAILRGIQVLVTDEGNTTNGKGQQ